MNLKALIHGSNRVADRVRVPWLLTLREVIDIERALNPRFGWVNNPTPITPSHSISIH